ncbi:MAG: T9SS type A sorting domain-containing protein [Sphingobacteriales bacterium]|nr:MAG: T9SS type A sorting domain-containing protein [Sphingobacteriales bacterium]
MLTRIPVKPKIPSSLHRHSIILLLVFFCLCQFQAFAQPANDLCGNAIPLTSKATCINDGGNVYLATYTPASGASTCVAGTDRYDVWFTFVAQSVNPTITISGHNNTYFVNPKIQVLSGSCGSFTNIGCGNTSYTTPNLNTGETYYIRVFSTTNTFANTLARGAFNICIDDDTRPANDLCSGATALTLSTGTTCGGTTNGTLFNALPTTGITQNCGNPNSPDVWYSFVSTAARPYPEIRIDNPGAQFLAAGLRLQLFAGTCAGLVPVNCTNTNGNTLSVGPGAALVPGTYYVRVYSNAATQNANTWNFRICARNSADPVVHNGKTYVNITKGSNGGTIEPNDELEIRTVLNIKSDATFNTIFTDNIPANTTYIPGTLRVLTNEGKIFRQFTDLADTDPASITAGAVTINLGNGATSTAGGSIRNTDRPSLFGSECILMASYRVRVNAIAYGTVLQVGGGSVAYRRPNNTLVTIAFSPIPAMVYANFGICTNTIGSNGIISEFGGTFGSGATKDRAASARVPANYIYAPFNDDAPGDYYYGISNNTSANAGAGYSINPLEPDNNKRVFDVWDIIGDHTGAADPLSGNNPTHVNGGQSGGYMVVINAAYRADTAFRDTVRNLCPNTSYEYSAWFRNICRKCGGDSIGTGASGANYIPTALGDSSGVRPNLTFNINGFDYYTTGDVLYSGTWIKKGFTYRTGPAETQMVINIRNNAPGGGGNDWAIDDIGVATCSPSLVMNPAAPVVNVCYGDGQSMSANVVSYYDNFTHWIWEKSVNNGATWVSSGYSGNTTPVYNGSEYEYAAVGPSVIGDSTTHGNLFRLRVASTPSNLADIDCSFRAIRTIQVMVQNCMYVLKTNIVNVSGVLQNSYGLVHWTSTNELPGVQYAIEKSTDGTVFRAIGSVNGKAANGFGEQYSFADPTQLKAAAYYRIAIKENGQIKYSKTILLSPGEISFDIKNLLNPFDTQLSFDVITPDNGNVKISVLDNFGRTIRSHNHTVYKGVTPIKITDHGAISNGIYNLKVEYGNVVLYKRMIKANK